MSTSNHSMCNNNHNNFFTTILEKLMPHVELYQSREFTFPPVNRSPNHDFIDEFFVRSFLSKPKFDALQEHINNNFLTKEKKDNNLKIFLDAQKRFWAFKRFYYNIYIKKKVKESECTEDLMMTPLSEYPDSLKIKILQSDTIYTFYINDLIKIINTSLTYAPQLFSEPTEPKNPYTNIPFSKANLYNIYFSISNSPKVMPKLIHLFFLSEFDIHRFAIDYEADIREAVLKKYYDDASDIKLYNDIILMLRKFRSSCPNLRIHPEFDRTKVINRFKHLLYHNIVSLYSHQPTKRLYHKRVIMKSLTAIYENNPTFGTLNIFDDVSYRTTGMFPQIQSNQINNNRPGIRIYQFSANLMDASLDDSDSVYDLLDQLVIRNRAASRRRPISRRESGDSLRPTTITNNYVSSSIEGGVTVSVDQEEGEVNEDEDSDDVLDDDNDDDDDDDEEEELESSTTALGLEVVGTNINRYVNNSTNTASIVSRYNTSTPLRIEYSTHAVTRFPSRYAGIANSLNSIDDAINNLQFSYNRRSGHTVTWAPSTIHESDSVVSPPTTLESETTLQNTNISNISDSIVSSVISNLNNHSITTINNNSYDASLDIDEDSEEVDSPTNNNDDNSNPFATTHPTGFDPNYHDSVPSNDEDDSNHNND